MSDRKIVIGFESYSNYFDNSRAFFEYLYKNHPDKFEFVWVIFREPLPTYELEIPDLKVIYNDAPNFENEFNKIDIMISSFNTGIYLKKTYQTWINVWHGVGSKKVNYLLNESYNFTQKNLYSNIDYFITTSELMKIIYVSAFDIDLDKFMLLGQPRNDYLFNSKSDEILKKCFDVDVNKYDKIILYMPTFRKAYFNSTDGSFNEKNFLNLLEYKEDDLIKYLEKNNYLLLIKLHPSEDFVIEINNNEYVKVLDKEKFKRERIEPNEIHNSIDLLMTDYSSAHSDYLLLEKPVLFIHADSDEYNDKRGILFNDFDLWFPGPKVKTIDEFISETNKLFANPLYYKNERERYNNVVNNSSQLNPAENCKRLADFIFDKVLDENKFEKNRYQKQIHELTYEINTKNNELNIKEIELYNKNIELQHKINVLNNKEVELNIKNNELDQKINEISNKEVELYNKNIELNQKNLELENKSTELNNIYHTRSYRLAKKISSIYQMIRLKK